MYWLTSEQRPIVASVAALADQHVAGASRALFWATVSRAVSDNGGERLSARQLLFRDTRAPVVMAPKTDQAHELIGDALCGLELFS